MSAAPRRGKGPAPRPPRLLGAADLGEVLAEAEAPAPLYVLGGDPFLCDEAVASIRRLAGLDGDLGRMNLDQVVGTEAAPEAVLGSLATAPFLGERRMAVVRRADPWLAAERREAVLAYAADPPPHAVLVLVCDRLDGRNAVVVAAARLGAAAHLWPPYDDREAARWLAARARARGLRLDREGVEALLEAVGADLASLAGEVEKLRTLHGGEPVGAAEVAAAVGTYREAGLKNFLSAVTRGDRAAALEAVDRSPAVRREAVLWTAAAARRLAQVRRAVPLVEGGASPETLQRRLKVWGKRDAAEVHAAASRARPEALERAVRRLRALDRGLKGGEAAAHLARIDRYVAGVCGR